MEELGTYVESHTEVVNFPLRKDQITVLTAGIVKTQILDENWDGERYWLQVEIEVDSGEVINSIDALRKDRKKTNALEEVMRRSEKLLSENERLRKELAGGKVKQKCTISSNSS